MSSNEMKEGFVNLFTDDPINWIKWILVFATLIISYIKILPIYGKVSHKLDIQRKVEKAVEKGHVLKGTLIKQYVSYDDSDNRSYSTDCHATYEYEINGKTKKFHALLINYSIAPRTMNLYYINNPRRIFSVEDYHWEPIKGLITAVVIFSPWIAAALVLIILRIPLN